MSVYVKKKAGPLVAWSGMGQIGLKSKEVCLLRPHTIFAIIVVRILGWHRRRSTPALNLDNEAATDGRLRYWDRSGCNDEGTTIRIGRRLG